jgi:hypothetical protein
MNVLNVGTLEIPPCCPVEVLGLDGTNEAIHKIRMPASASLSQVMISGQASISAGSYDSVSDDWPQWSRFSGLTQPTIGGQVGAAAGTDGMQSGLTGFLCLAIHGTVNTAGTLADDGTGDSGTVLVGGRLLVRPFASAESPLFYSKHVEGELAAIHSDHYSLYDPDSWLAKYTSLAGTLNTSTKALYHALKPASSNYYFALASPYRVYRSTAPTSGYTDTNWPFGSTTSAPAILNLLPSVSGRVISTSRTAVGTLYSGTNLQIMEFFPTAGSAGTWGTSLITADASRCAEIAYSLSNRLNQLGPWNGRVLVPAGRSNSSGATPDTDFFPVYDGTTWDYVKMEMATSGTLWRDNIGIAFCGAESSRYC